MELHNWGYVSGFSPAVANGVVYIGSDNYSVYAFGPSPATPEFPPYLILRSLIIATLVAALVLKKKRNEKV